MFKKMLKKREQGFTIIEVMIVLAIAGLILVVVLVAIPQLQRNQRDSARQNVASRLATELGTYSTNNGGAYPFVSSDKFDSFIDRYIGGTPSSADVVLELKNPKTGEQYEVDFETSSTGAVPTENQLLIYPGGKCDGEDVTGTLSASSRQFALRVALERNNTFFCTDNI